jgi:hypothetical protein
LNVSLADLPDEAVPVEPVSVSLSWQNMHEHTADQHGSKIHLRAAPDLSLNFRETKYEAFIPSINKILHCDWSRVVELLNPWQRLCSFNRSRQDSV